MSDKYTYSNRYHTPLFRCAFFRAIEPELIVNADGPQSKNWSLTAILPAGTDISNIYAAIADAATKCWGDKANAVMASPKFRSALKDGGTQVSRDGELYDGFEKGQITFKLSTKQRAPGIVDRLARPILDASGTTLTDKANSVYEIIPENVAYSGCWFYATFCAQAYDRADGRGVSLKLENLQLVRQDQRFGAGGSCSAEDDFSPLTVAETEELAALLA
ncbi:MAG: ssDNA-binding protein [Rhodospirillaceae bacterium]